MALIGIMFYFVVLPLAVVGGAGYIMGRFRLKIRFYRDRPDRGT